MLGIDVSLFSMEIALSFWHVMEEDVLLLTYPKDWHTRHGLAFMRGVWWNFLY